MSATTLKGFVRKHAWAKAVGAVLIVVLMPVWIVAFILAFIFMGPYETVRNRATVGHTAYPEWVESCPIWTSPQIRRMEGMGC
jgi:hypothetical protein